MTILEPTVCSFCAKNECHACRPDITPCSCAAEGHPGRDESQEPSIDDLSAGEPTSDQLYAELLESRGYFDPPDAYGMERVYEVTGGSY